MAAFCRRSRIPQASFYAWRRKLRDVGAGSNTARSAADFTEVRVAPEPDLMGDWPLVPSGLVLVLLGGRRIVVRPGFDRATLLALVDALERGSCAGSATEVGVSQAVHDR